LTNQLDIDIWEVIDAAATKPFGFQAFYPGPGVGGHCIPIDPNYLSYTVRSLGYQFRFVELAQEVSGRMPAYVTSRVQRSLNDLGKAVNGSVILLLGVTYKANIGDHRETPARPVARRLIELGADVRYHDPHVDQFDVDGTPLKSEADLGTGVANADLAILLHLTSARGWPVVLFALAGLFVSVFYVAPPLRLKQRGLGEPGVALVWGPLMIGGT
ncbi:MAG: hypothetical protein GY773_03600, partial [Actinomycetia bacterium]|nr:hypothetical protein [Actinomycetes bacterium]